MAKTASGCRAALGCLCSIVLLGCMNHRFERHVVFGGPAATRIERVRQYSLEDQYKIFRYGNDVVEPPLMNLAGSIAERGATVVPFLLNQLNAEKNDTVLRDTLLIFERMAVSKSYDVKPDPALMSALDAKIAGMKDKGWKSVCLAMFGRIKTE
jgi:hypothetical protein